MSRAGGLTTKKVALMLECVEILLGDWGWGGKRGRGLFGAGNQGSRAPENRGCNGSGFPL